MKRRSITVIKKVELGTVPGPEAKSQPKSKIDIRRSVGNWITERRETAILERNSSDEAISGWRLLPHTK